MPYDQLGASLGSPSCSSSAVSRDNGPAHGPGFVADQEGDHLGDGFRLYGGGQRLRRESALFFSVARSWGATALTRMPCGRSSTSSVRTR
jgi:hypothetical protein